MKKTICMIGPFPPPINGNSKAFDTIYQSEKCNQLFNLNKIDTSKLYSGHTGKLSLSKIFGFFRLKKEIHKIQTREIIDTYYISMAQTTVGVIRDIMLIREILHQKKDYKIVMHLHGGRFRVLYDQSPSILKKLIYKYYSKTDKIIVLGKSLRNLFDGIFDENKILVIPNCVDDDMLMSDREFSVKIEKLKKSKKIRVLYLSNLIESKGFKDVLYAAIEYYKVNPNVTFTFAGKFIPENEKSLFFEEIEKHNAHQYIKYVGIVLGDEKRKLLAESNIFVLPTYYPNEGQPISIIEAMGAGMPVLATDHAGIRDLLEDGVNGYFVNKKSPESIVQALKKISDIETVVSQGRESRKKVLENYTEEKYILNMCDVF